VPGAEVQKKSIVWKLKGDMDLVVLASRENDQDKDKNKEIIPVCEARFRAFHTSNVPDLGVQYHTVSPLLIKAEAMSQ
jgi:hypothetical protein